MGFGTGLDKQFGFKKETTTGAAVTVTSFGPLVSESITAVPQRVESEATFPGHQVQSSAQWRPGLIKVGGDIGLELPNRGAGSIFEAMFGHVATTGSGPFVHTYTPGNLNGLSHTIQIGRPGTAGTVIPYTYAGCKVASWEIASEIGKFATLGLTILAMSELEGPGLAAATFPAGLTGFIYLDGSITIEGTAVKVKTIKVAADHHLADSREFHGQATIDEPLQEDLSTYTVNLEMEFIDNTHTARLNAGTEHPVVLTYNDGLGDTLAITMNGRYDGEPATVGGNGIVTQNLALKLVRPSTSDAGAITAVLTNSDAT